MSKEISATPLTFVVGAWAEDQLGIEVAHVDATSLELSGRFAYQIAVSPNQRFASIAAIESAGQKRRPLATVGTDRQGWRIVAQMIRQCEEMGICLPKIHV